MCLTQKELNKSALEKLAIVLTEDAAQIDKEVLVSKLFSTKVIAKDLIAMECKFRYLMNVQLILILLFTCSDKFEAVEQ